MFSLSYILGILYSYCLYLCRFRTGERGTHLCILEGKIQIHPTIPSVPSGVTSAAGPLQLAPEQSLPDGR